MLQLPSAHLHYALLRRNCHVGIPRPDSWDAALLWETIDAAGSHYVDMPSKTLHKPQVCIADFPCGFRLPALAAGPSVRPHRVLNKTRVAVGFVSRPLRLGLRFAPTAHANKQDFEVPQVRAIDWLPGAAGMISSVSVQDPRPDTFRDDSGGCELYASGLLKRTG